MGRTSPTQAKDRQKVRTNGSQFGSDCLWHHVTQIAVRVASGPPDFLGSSRASRLLADPNAVIDEEVEAILPLTRLGHGSSFDTGSCHLPSGFRD
jgi:hypothetical protein